MPFMNNNKKNVILLMISITSIMLIAMYMFGTNVIYAALTQDQLIN